MPKTTEKLIHFDRISREFPEYAELLTLFRELGRFTDGREGDTGITFTLKGTGSLHGDVPLVGEEDLVVDTATCGQHLDGIIEVMLTVGKEGAEPLSRLRSAVREGRLDLRQLLVACLTRERRVIEESAVTLDVPASLLEFLLETSLHTALELVAETVPSEAVAGWQQSFCPVCGSRPGMAELVGEEGRRQLSCAACSFVWPFSRLTCPYCGNDDADKLSYFDGAGPVRVDVCNACSRYLKTRDSRKGNAGVPLAAEDLTTMHLDLIAAREGYERGK